MRIIVNGYSIIGDADEMVELLRKLPSQEVMDREGTIAKKQIMTKSDILRNKLEQDPNYNPFGGVVPSKETLIDMEQKRSYNAERDTGIEYE